MKLIAVLIALLCDRVFEAHRESRLGHWIGAVSESIAIRLPAEGAGVLAALTVVLPPALLMLLVQWLIGCWLYGLVGLVLGIVVLLFMLGPLDVRDVLEDYIEARGADDRERSDWYYERFTGEQVPDSAQEESRDIVEAVLVRAHDHLFATIFWFCLLGPAGAVLYRVAGQAALVPPPGIIARPELLRALRFLLGLLGWIPARLMALGYAVTGSFEHAMAQLRAGAKGASDVLTGNTWVLTSTGAAALRGDEAIARHSPEESGERRSAKPAQMADVARRLVTRTLVLWLAVLALLTLVGWLS